MASIFPASNTNIMPENVKISFFGFDKKEGIGKAPCKHGAREQGYCCLWLDRLSSH